MSLLVGNLHQWDAEYICQKLCVGHSDQKAGHIAPFHRSGAGADADGTDVFRLNIGKQPAGKLRQAFDVGEYSIGLAQTQLP